MAAAVSVAAGTLPSAGGEAAVGRLPASARERAWENALAKRVQRANRLYKAGKFREANTLYEAVVRRVKMRGRGGPAFSFEPDPFTEEALLEVRGKVSPEAREAIIEALIERGDRFLDVGDEDAAANEYEKVFLLDARNGKASAAMDRARAKALARLREERESVTAHAE